MSAATPNIRDLSRDDLNAYAATSGIVEPHGFASKEALIAAVEAAQGEATTSTTTSTTTAAPAEGETDDDA